MTAHDGSAATARRRSRETDKRCRVVKVSLTDDEYTQVSAAAQRLGLALGAYAALATLAAARATAPPQSSPLREALTELMRASGLVRRVGVNLNQAVTKLNATGQPDGDLAPSAAVCTRAVRRLDEAAEQVRRRLS